MSEELVVGADHAGSGGGKKEVMRITLYLSIITLVELALGYWMAEAGFSEESGMRQFIKGVIMLLMLWKAFYIVAYFMHLKHELRNFISTVLMPLILFIWFIIAFLRDGDSFRKLKNTHDPYHHERSTLKMEVHEDHSKH